jgi:hypothetical protein
MILNTFFIIKLLLGGGEEWISQADTLLPLAIIFSKELAHTVLHIYFSNLVYT